MAVIPPHAALDNTAVATTPVTILARFLLLRVSCAPTPLNFLSTFL